MSCTQYENLLPLYAGGDLPEADAAALRAHLVLCPDCQALLNAYSESLAWLQHSSLPPFDEQVYSELRAAVHADIARWAAQDNSLKAWLARWSEKLPSFWQPPVLLATATCGALLLSWLGWNVFRPQPSVPTLANNSQRPAPSPSLAVAVPTGPTGPIEPIDLDAGTPHAPALRGGRQRLESPQQYTRLNSAPPPPAETNNLLTDGINELNANGEAGTETDLNTNAAAEQTAPAPEMLRIEMRTADPNIRIIWLAPKSPAASQTETKADLE